MKNQKKSETIEINLSDTDRKTIEKKCKAWGITMDEYFDRAVFIAVFNASLNETPKERQKTLKRILGGDIDLEYYEAKMDAIMIVRGINVRNK
jgi:hypothetical protein